MKNMPPVSRKHVPPAYARVNYDGSPAIEQEYGVIKRKVRGNSGHVKNQFLTSEGYVIPDVKKYIRWRKEYKKRKAADKITQTFAEMETPRQKRSGARTAHAYDKNRGGYVSKTANERLDREIDRARNQKDNICLDKAFPDIGVYETGHRHSPVDYGVRARQAAVHGHRYQKEYILRTVHRLLLRNIPVD